MNKVTKIGLLAIAVVALVSLSVGACHRHRPHHNPEKANKFVTWKINDTLDDLEATEAQRQKILSIKDDLFQQILTMRQNGQGDKWALVQELQSDQPNGEKLHRLLDKHIDALRVTAHRGVDALLEVHGTLTPEQRAQLIKEHSDCLANH